MRKLHQLYYLLVLLSCAFNLKAQPILNQRYIIDTASNSVFGSVISTDSCYYVSGMHTSSPSAFEKEGSFLKINQAGLIIKTNEFDYDGTGIDLWQGYNLLQTLDGHFACVGIARKTGLYSAFIFMKIKENGDTLTTNFIYDFYENDFSIGTSPSTLIQHSDSTYYGLVHFFRQSDLLTGVTFFRLDKNGSLLYWKNYYGLSVDDYRLLTQSSLVKTGENELIIGASLKDLSGGADYENHRMHTKLIKIDTLGEIISDTTYWDEDYSYACNSITKTTDGGLLYCGKIGTYNEEFYGIDYKSRVVKLNADLSVDWQLVLGGFAGETTTALYKILPLSETEFVVVGNHGETVNLTGWLIKFNIEGHKIWERKYYKVPRFEGEVNAPIHVLYDVDQTPDDGFVMVGQSINFYEDNGYLFGQKGWLVKTDKYGCLVPDCQLIAEGIAPSPIDTNKTKNPPSEEPIKVLYPNPASESIFYYHHQDNFQFGTAYIYNVAGQVVQKWEITSTDITYEIDVSELGSGNYIIKVFNALGEALETERFVKI